MTKPCGMLRKYSAVPTSAAASAPKACERAVRWGTAVIGIRYARGMPATMPMAKATAIQLYVCTSVPQQGVDDASDAMPSSPANTPRRAVAGEFIHSSERMNRAAATI